MCAYPSLLAAVALSLAVPAEGVGTRYEELAGRLAFFPTGEFLMGRADRFHYPPPKQWVEPWRQALAAISDERESVGDLVGLLKHNDPKVRTLALAALFQRQDARLLPHLASLINDRRPTLPDFQVFRSMTIRREYQPVPEDFHKQTVGDVAARMVRFWLEPAGYQLEEFADYWKARKGRTHCASWFLVRLYRAGQGTSTFDEMRIPLIRAIRKEVDALSGADRDWTLLWVAAHHYPSLSPEPVRHFATDAERLEAARRLGPARLMDLLQGRAISDDPDLAPDDPRSRGRHDLALWVLGHAGQLLRRKDAPAVLHLEKKLRGRPPAGVIAAAELQPENARKWLRAAMGRYAADVQQTSQASHRASLAAALWRVLGESEIDYLADWFFKEQVAGHPHTTQTEQFLRDVQKAREPANRKLVARLVTDPRLAGLDYQSLRALVQVANGWTKMPVIPHNALYPPWEKGTHAPQTPADLLVLDRWRAALRQSVAAWRP